MRLALLLVVVLLACILMSADARRASKSKPSRTRRPPPRRNKRKKNGDVNVPDPVSYDIVAEQRHSLAEPMQDFAQHWITGGSTVLTKNLVRLTPSVADQQGWVWNQHALDASNFEIEVELQVYSKPHFGGEGLGVWFLHKSMSPMTYQNNPTCLSGPLMGMREDFKGFGLVLDVYDNDHMRDNPQLIVLENLAGDRKFDQDRDFTASMFKRLPAGDELQGHEAKDGVIYRSQKCQAELRNTGQSSKLLIKVIDKVVHVYVNEQTLSRASYKFCLAVELPDSVTIKKGDYHLALSAGTGEVADAHDIKKVTTRYLADDAVQINDAEFFDATMWDEDSLSRSGAGSFGALLNMIIFGLCALVGFQYKQLTTMLKQQLDTVMICNKINPLVLPHYILHGLFVFMTMLCGYWWTFLFNLPLLGYHGLTVFKGTYKFRAYLLSKLGGKGMRLDAPQNQLLLQLAWYILQALYFFIF